LYSQYTYSLPELKSFWEGVSYYITRKFDCAASGYPKWYYTSKPDRAAYKYADTSFPAVSGTVWEKVPNVRLYYTLAGPKTLSSLTGVQASTEYVTPGSTNNPILRLDFGVTGINGTLNLTEIKVTSNNTDDADITASGVKAYRTSVATFSTEHQFGSATSFSEGMATFTDTYDLPSGTTYIWIAYDIASGATLGHTVDAKVLANNVTVNSSTYPASD
jgi:hypothetical protein